MRAAIYVRISDDREGREVGVKNQEDACRKRCKAEGWKVVEVYRDNDTGASSRSRKTRPMYAEMLRAAQDGDFDVVVSYSTSRLTRRPRELETWLTLAESGALTACFLTGPAADWSSAQGRAIARTLSAWDAQEAEITGDRVSFAFAAIARRGGRHGGVRGFGWDDKGMELVPAEAEAIRDATRRVIAGEVSILALCREWEAAGFKPTRGGKWHTITVRRILMRPTNAGYAIYRGEILKDDDGQPVLAAWEPIVTPDEWQAVCSVLTDSSRLLQKGNTPKNLVTNLATCSLCGSPMRSAGVGTVKNRYEVYRCSNVASCGKQTISRKVVDEAVIAAVVNAYQFDLDNELPKAEDDRTAARLKSMRAELAKVEEDRAKIMELRDVYTAAEIRAEVGPLNKRRDQLAEAIRQAVAVDAHAAMAAEVVGGLYEDAQGHTRGSLGLPPGNVYRARFEDLPLAKRRTIIRALFRITVSPGKGPSRVEFERRERQQLAS